MVVTTRRPEWFSAFRAEQEDLISKAVTLFQAGVKVVIAEAPPGIGKTLSGVEIGQRLGVPTVYTATTKQLQEQAARDFPWAKVLMGRRNYLPTGVEAGGDITCEDCDASKYARPCPACGTNVAAKERTCPGPKCGKDVPYLEACTFCPNVDLDPYRLAKQDAVGADLAVLNTAYLLREIQGEGSAFRDSPFVVIDECDLLESNIASFVEVSVSPSIQRRVGISPPPRKTVAGTWPAWLEDTGNRIDRHRKRLIGNDIKTRRTRRYLGQIKANLEKCRDDLAEDLGSWIYDYSTPKIVFRPVRVAHLAPEVLWSKVDQVLLMSATVISAQVMADDLGLTQDQWASITCPFIFPAANRPIYVKAVADMTWSKKDVEYPKMAEGVAQLCATRPDDRILVHAVSYDLASRIMESLPPDRAITYRSTDKRLEALEEYRARDGAILVAPSMERGVDLKDEDCRMQILVKVPYLSLGDKQVSARLYGKGGQIWYAVTTIRTIIQATGRGVRHEEDFATTWILDGQFLKLARKWGYLFPTGWKEAVSTRTAGWVGVPNGSSNGNGQLQEG